MMTPFSLPSGRSLPRRLHAILNRTLFVVGGFVLWFTQAVQAQPSCFDYEDSYQWLATIQPPMRWAEVRGNLLYGMDDDCTIRILDVSDPSSPIELGSAPGWHCSSFALQDDLFIVAGFETLLVYDISMPTAPTQVGGASFGNLSVGAAVDISGDHAFVITGCCPSEVLVFDISDPTSPTLVGNPLLLDSANFNDILVHGNVAYATNTKLFILDVSDPSAIALIDSIETSLNPSHMFLDESTLYVGQSQTIPASLLSFDVSNPTAPVLLDEIETESNQHVTVDGNTLYATSYTAVELIDISDPANMVMLGRVRVERISARTVLLGNDLIYALDPFNGLHLFDVSRGPSPIVASLPTQNLALDVEGTLAYTATLDGMRIIDISNPFAPAVIGSLGTLQENTHIVVNGDRAYLTGVKNGLIVVDVTDPTSPQITLQWNATLYETVVEGEWAYSAGFNRVYVSDPDTTWLSTIVSSTTVAGARDIVKVGDTLLVGSHSLGLVFLDVTDPEAPSVFHSLPMPTQVFSLAATAEYAYLADADGNTYIVDISNPLQASIVGSISTPGAPRHLHVDDNLLYLSLSSLGVFIVDVANPQFPRLLGTRATLRSAVGSHVSGDHLLVADYLHLTVLPKACVRVTSNTQRPRQKFSLRAWPNPSRQEFSLSYSLQRAQPVELQVFDPRGRLVRILHSGPGVAGENVARWNGLDRSGQRVSSGIYYVRLRWNGGGATRRLIVVQ